MTPDVRNLLRHVRVPGFAYREFGAAASPARVRRSERREGLFTVALVSLVPKAGRTALCANLARAFEHQGAKASAVDVDPRGVLSATFGSAGRDPSACIEQLAADHDVLLVDTPVPPPEDVLSEADELLVVARPDAASLAAVRPMEALLVRTRMRSWRKARARWLVNAFDGRRAADRQAIAALRRELGSRVLPIVVQEDRGLAAAFAAGKLVHDAAPASQAAADLEALARELHRSGRAADRHASIE